MLGLADDTWPPPCETRRRRCGAARRQAADVPRIGFTTYEALPPGGRVHIVGAGTGRSAARRAAPDGGRRRRSPLREARRVHARPDGAARVVPRRRLDRELLRPIRSTETTSRRSSIRWSSHEAIEYPALDSARPDGAAARLDAGLLPAERDRAVLERSDRRRARRRPSNGCRRRRRADDAIAMLEPGDMLIDCSGATRCFATTLFPGPMSTIRPRTRTRSSSSTRSSSRSSTASPTTATSTASTTRTPGTSEYKFIPSVHRTYSDGNVTHVTGIVTITADEFDGDAAAVRRRCGSATTSPMSPSRWTGSSTRSRRRPTARSSASWRSSGSR